MAEADAKHWHSAEELLDVFDGVADRLGIAGAIRKEHAVGFEIEDVLGRRLRGDDPNVAVVVNEKAQDVLLNAEVVGGHAEFSRVRNPAGLAHGFRPRRNGEFDGAFFPAVGFFAGDVAGEFLSGHGRQLLGFEDQLLGGSAVGGHDAAESANIANVAYEGAGIDIPNGGNFVAIQIELGGFGRAPVRGNLRELAHDERFNVRAGGFFIVEIRADIADMRIGQTDDLAGVTWVGENFLITGETGIENDFATAARDGARGAAVKYAPVFQSENGGAVLNFGQFVLRAWS